LEEDCLLKASLAEPRDFALRTRKQRAANPTGTGSTQPTANGSGSRDTPKRLALPPLYPEMLPERPKTHLGKVISLFSLSIDPEVIGKRRSDPI